jgi:uncharacterized protein YjeT (DUF2065 family)
MWDDLLRALALLLVLEGLLPFLNPEGMRRALRMMGEMGDRQIRVAGLASMLVGVVLLYLIRN